MRKLLLTGPVVSPTIASAGCQRALQRHYFQWGPLTHFQVMPQSPWYWAITSDLSTRGIGMIVGQPFRPGTGLAIHLRSSRSRTSYILLGDVRHATPIGDESWLLGCDFARGLSADDLAQLIEEEKFDFN
jgi:hypothetical protein